MALVLGSVTFAGYEIPEHMPFGGEQRVHVHKLVGGERVVDAMGPDDADIVWSGRFQGGDAVGRARQLDRLRKSGAEVSLSWMGLFYRVIVTHFRAQTERFYQVPYEIGCTVIEDPSSGLGSALAATLDSLVAGDLTAAAALPLSDAPETAVASLQTAVTTAGALQGADPTTLAPVLTAADAASTSLGSAVTASDVLINTASVGGVTAGGFPPDMATGLLAQVVQVQTETALLDAQALIGRVNVNLQNAQG